MTTSPPIIDNAAARRLFIFRHGLADDPRPRQSPAALLDLIRRIGFVQVDSINTVARAHDMILFARNQTYRPRHLMRLLQIDRVLFENWTHDASIIPMEFFPYWRRRFLRQRERLLQRWKVDRRGDFLARTHEVAEHIARHGPVLGRDLGGDEVRTSGGWWDWHPSKTAMEFLWRTGDLAIAGRNGFEKIFDLTDRVVPEHFRTGLIPDEPAMIDWACNAALDRLGFATSGEIGAFWGSVTPAEAAAWCKAALGRNLIEADIATARGGKLRRVFARPDLPEAARAAAEAEPPRRVRMLSPFDPLIRDRSRAERLFGFHYRIEVFVPEAKRRYGYYVFPLLEGDRLIGRIDARRRRDRRALEVDGLWFEPGVRRTAGRIAAIDAELERYRRFTGAEAVAWNVSPARPS